jgi:deazaflavin-dependent oxidoreductase (nitroreductase family)
MGVRESVIDLINRTHRALFDASKGRIGGGRLLGMPVVQLTTTGRKSGEARRTMLTSPFQDDERIVLVASFGGAAHHPAWYLNLRADPNVTVTMQGRTREMVARTASPAERDELWPQILKTYKGYDSYRERTEREIPVVILEDPGGSGAA